MQYRDIMQFARETSDPNFSLSVPQVAKTLISDLVAVIDGVHALVKSTDGDYIDGASFEGLAGEIQAVLRDAGVIRTSADSSNEGST